MYNADIEIEQEDRIAAHKYMKMICDHRWSHQAILNGHCDNTSVVLAFAEHRLSAERRVARLYQGRSVSDKVAAY